MHVGELHLVMAGRGVSLRYAPGWLRQGFALSEDLPMIDREHLPAEKDNAAGAVDDARPVVVDVELPDRVQLVGARLRARPEDGRESCG